jgi:hypothetical protein
MKSLLFSLFFLINLNLFSIEKIQADPKITNLINQLVEVLSLEDESIRIQKLLPLIHDSMKTNDKKDLFTNVKQFSYKKAVSGISRYKIPVELGEVHKGKPVTIEGVKGRRDKYFIRKKEGSTGMPAPIHVFIPEDGSEAKIIDFGSI